LWDKTISSMTAGTVKGVSLPKQKILPVTYVTEVRGSGDILKLDDNFRQYKAKATVLFIDDFSDYGSWVQVRRVSDSKFLVKIKHKEAVLPFQNPPKDAIRVILDFETGKVKVPSSDGKPKELTSKEELVVNQLVRNSGLLNLLDAGYHYNCIVSPSHQMDTASIKYKRSYIIFYDAIPDDVIEKTFRPKPAMRGTPTFPVVTEMNPKVPNYGDIGLPVISGNLLGHTQRHP